MLIQGVGTGVPGILFISIVVLFLIMKQDCLIGVRILYQFIIRFGVKRW